MRARRLLDQPVLRWCAGPLTAAVLTCLTAGWALQVWRWRPGDPVALDWDSGYVTAWVRVLVSVGPTGVDPTLGAPFGLNMSWFDTGDALHFAVLRFLGLFLQPLTAAAVYFFLGFPLAALTMYWLARRLELSRTAAVVIGVLFAVLPGHQTRYPHLLLSEYWTLPFGLWLILAVARGESLWPPVTGSKRAAWRSRVGMVAATLLTGLSGGYFAAFVLVVLASVLVIRLWRRSEPRVLLPGLGVCVGIVVPVLLGMLADSRGKAADLLVDVPPSQRSPMQSELYAGRAIDLVLPWGHHRLEALSQLVTLYRENSISPHPEEMAIGLIALVGIVVALILVLRSALVRDRPVPALLGAIGVCGLVAFGFYTKGGLSAITALVGLSSIRTWARMSLVIGGLGLLAVGVWLTTAAPRRGLRQTRMIAAVLLVVGVLDQTNSAVAPDYAGSAQRLAGIRAFTDELERTLDPGCAVFQLPVMEFPEPLPRFGLSGYDELLPSATSHTLRWSAGAITATSAGAWQQGLDDADIPTLTRDLASVGFCALVLHRQGYGSTDPIADRLAAGLGAPIAADENEQLVAYSLDGARRALLADVGTAGLEARRDGVLHPVLVRVGADSPRAGRDGTVTQTFRDQAIVQISNVAGQARGETVVRVQLLPVDAQHRSVVATLPGGGTVTGQLDGTGPADLTLRLPSLAPGLTTVRISVSGSPVAIDATTTTSARLRLIGAASEGTPRVVTLAHVPPPLAPLG